MTVDQFWQMIEQSRAAAERGEDPIAYLDKAIGALPPREMVSFEGNCWDLLSLSFRRELWAAAAIIEPACSQGAFDALRAWLILQGKEVFDRVVANPVRLADCPPLRSTPWQTTGSRLLDLVPRNYQKATGEEMPTVPRKIPYVIKGPRWTEHELPEMYPELWRKYRN